jgi:hypothetical protein
MITKLMANYLINILELKEKNIIQKEDNKILKNTNKFNSYLAGCSNPMDIFK